MEWVIGLIMVVWLLFFLSRGGCWGR